MFRQKTEKDEVQHLWFPRIAARIMFVEDIVNECNWMITRKVKR